MPLEKLALICVVIFAVIWSSLLLASAVAAFPYGLIVLLALLVAGYFIYRVVRERMENKEDDYYEKNIKQ
jgi:membrane protein implicated in regulation of membrane protease activity